jgi:hypothetical protein
LRALAVPQPDCGRGGGLNNHPNKA